MVSKSMSPRLSAPQTLQRFRLSLVLRPRVLPREGLSRLERPPIADSSPSEPSLPDLILEFFSSSKAASSASGESGMVSKLEILGLRDLSEVGVDGTEDEYAGKL